MNPLKRVPVLLIDGQPLWETRIIYQYLHRQRGLAPLSLAEDNGLSAIDTLQDQLIQRFLLGRFEHPLLTNNAYFRRGAERQRLTLAFLNEQVRSGVYRRWDYPAMSLYTLLDWSLFRQSLQLVELGDDLMEFLAANRHQRLVAETDPRLA